MSHTFKTISFFAIFSSIQISAQVGTPSKTLPTETLAQKKGIKVTTEKSAPVANSSPAPSTTSSAASAPKKSTTPIPQNAQMSQTAPTPAALITPPPPAQSVSLQSAVSSPATPASSEEESSTQSAFALSEERAHLPKMRVGFGYTHSRWSQFSPRIKDGSYSFDFGFEREWRPRIESGLHFNFLGTSTDSSANENVRAFHVAFMTRYLLMPGSLQPFAGLGLGVGTYRVWSLGSEYPTSVTFLKHASGVLFGVFPEVGMRMVLNTRAYFDLSLGYTGYVSAPQWKAGGVNVLLAFGIAR